MGSGVGVIGVVENGDPMVEKLGVSPEGGQQVAVFRPGRGKNPYLLV